MSALDIVLNCAALLLWLNWWSRGFSTPRASGIALVSTLRRAEPARRDRWKSPAVLLGMVLFRAVLYWQVGPALRWSPRLSLVAITIPFRSDSFLRMLLFSVLSLLVFAAAVYFCLFLVSAINRKLPANDPWQGFVRIMLGVFDRLPAWIKVLLPFWVAVLFWLVCGPLLSSAGVQVPVKSFAHRFQEAMLIGIGSYTAWRYVIGIVLVLHVVTSYVYLGNSPFWHFILNTARNLLRPLAPIPLRVGKFDFAPVVALAIVFAAAELLGRVLPEIYAKLPL